MLHNLFAKNGSLKGASAGRLAVAASVSAVMLAVIDRAHVTAHTSAGTPAQRLEETGLYADFEALRVDPKHIAFAPQYALWTDGAKKQRWLSLPPGTAIDGSNPDVWVFPVGTRFWKEFSLGGTRVETRFMEFQPNRQWHYASYAWSADGRDAFLVSSRGRRNAHSFGNGRSHTIPSVNDCKACHQGGQSDVLGFSALQLSPDRDPGALHSEAPPAGSVDLKSLIEKRLLVGLPVSVLEAPPKINAATPAERAALGYLHGNCGHCHNNEGSLKNVGLFLRHVIGAEVQPAVKSSLGEPVRKPAPGQTPDAVLRVEPGQPDRSALLQRISSRYAPLQMPPLGTEVVDSEAVSLLRQWILDAATSHSETLAKGRNR